MLLFSSISVERDWVLQMYSILLVDDEHLVIKGIRIILEKTCLSIGEIREAENGEEAMELIREKVPDIIITDIRMPIVNGLELCRKVYKKCPNTSIIIISGYDDFKYAQEAIKYGVRQYLLKPIQKMQLLKTVGDIIEEKEEAKRLLYISHKDMETLIEKFENGIWNNSDIDVRGGLTLLHRLLNSLPIDFCIKISNELFEILLGKLSLKIGYTLMIQIDEYKGFEKNGFFSWTKQTINKIQLELIERKKNSDYNLFEMAKQYLTENYNEEITLEELAHKTGFSTNYFSKLFKTKIGKTFVQFKSEIRIQKAMEFLQKPEKSVTEVSLDVGYNDLTYFIRVFKEYTGFTPNEYKRKRGMI